MPMSERAPEFVGRTPGRVTGIVGEPEDHEELFEDVRAERDAVRQELADLRAWLSVKLGLVERESGPGGLTTLSVASDKAIIAKSEELLRKQG
jgi:hypothetical protein